MRRPTVGMLAAVLMLVAAGAPFALAQIPVTDDTFTSTAAPAKNYGGAIAIVLQSPTAPGSLANPSQPSGYVANAYLRFDLAGSLPSGLAASNVSKATLRLYVDAIVSPGTFDVYLANGPWSESTLTVNTPPPPLGALVTSGIHVTTVLKYIDVDVTSAVQAWLNGTANNGLVLVPSTGSNIFAAFDSKENPLTSQATQLNVILVSAGPQGPQGPQGPLAKGWYKTAGANP